MTSIDAEEQRGGHAQVLTVSSEVETPRGNSNVATWRPAWRGPPWLACGVVVQATLFGLLLLQVIQHFVQSRWAGVALCPFGLVLALRAGVTVVRTSGPSNPPSVVGRFRLWMLRRRTLR